MPNKTLYVSDDDAAIWSKAQEAAGPDGERSLSKVVTTALAQYVASREPVEDEFVAEAAHRVEDRELVRRVRALIRRTGVDNISWAFGRALILEGASRSRAATKAQATLGPEGRAAAARKAVAAKGVEGQRRAARKAWATRKATASR